MFSNVSITHFTLEEMPWLKTWDEEYDAHAACLPPLRPGAGAPTVIPGARGAPWRRRIALLLHSPGTARSHS